jgi:hypothetical protein
MYAKEQGQLKATAATAFADGKESGTVRFSILQFHFFCKQD